MKIPIIDLAEQNAEKQLHNAFINFGFAYIKTYVKPDKILNYSKKFFNLPKEEKNKIKYNSTETNSGYQGMIESLTPGTPVDLKEGFNWIPYGNNQWYDNEQYFSCMDWTMEVNRISNLVLMTIEQALGLDSFSLVQKHYWSKSTTGRLLHYLPWQQSIEENQMRGGEHTDYGTITILFTDGNPGLQIKPRNQNDWIDAPYIEGTCIINVGDLLQRWTNDIYMSTPHRVVNSNLNCSRYSFPFFVHPDDNVLVDSLVGKSKYEPITAKSYLVWRLNQSY